MRLSCGPWVLVVAALVCVGHASNAHAAKTPVNIIFDTDMGGDCDDVGAIFMLHGAIERGEANLLATMGCVSSEAIGPALSAINTWFGRPEILVGVLKDPGLLVGPHYTQELARRYPPRFPNRKDFPDVVSLYRKVLARQPDGSVTIVAVGPLRNLANLLQSAADESSPLRGPELIAKKVKRLDVMGGHYPPDAKPKDAEWNFKQDPASAALVCADWPTEVLFNGEGGSTNSGRRVTYEMPEHNPLTMAYRHYPGTGYAGDRLSWDPVSCLVAVRGAAPWYEVVGGGENVVDAKTGVNNWKPHGRGKHSYLVLDRKKPKAEVEKALEDLMTAGKGRPTGLLFDTAYYATAGMCQITSRGSASIGTVAIKAFDQDEKTAWHDRAKSSWIQCQYVDGRKYTVTSYAVSSTDTKRQPLTLELSGSNDGGATWARLDFQMEPGFSERMPRREFIIAKPTKFNIYRLSVTAADGNEGVQISAIELNEAIHCQPKVTATSVVIDRKEVELPVHGRATLNATVAPAQTFGREVVWSSSDPSVAEVRRVGEQIAIVVGKKVGSCTVLAKIDGVQHACKVSVSPSTLPDAWSYSELSAPAIPGEIAYAGGVFRLTGCGHAMSSFWQRVQDQGVFVSRPASDKFELSGQLKGLAPNVGGPLYNRDSRPPSASGLMIREPHSENCGRFVLIQVESTGALVARWRDKSGDVDGGKSKKLGEVTLPVRLKLARTNQGIEFYTSTDGKDWGKPRFTHGANFNGDSRVGLFVCSGNTFASTTATFDLLEISE